MTASPINIPPGARVAVLVYPNPLEDDLEPNREASARQREAAIQQLALAGVEVVRVPFNRLAYEAWLDKMPDTRAARAEWAGLQINH